MKGFNGNSICVILCPQATQGSCCQLQGLSLACTQSSDLHSRLLTPWFLSRLSLLLCTPALHSVLLSCGQSATKGRRLEPDTSIPPARPGGTSLPAICDLRRACHRTGFRVAAAALWTASASSRPAWPTASWPVCHQARECVHSHSTRQPWSHTPSPFPAFLPCLGVGLLIRIRSDQVGSPSGFC